MTARLSLLCLSERRPRDFSARVKHGRALRRALEKRRRARSRTALLLAGAVGLPAFAAPADWQAFALSDAAALAPLPDPMPFERAGDSFPGSAFYYLRIEGQSETRSNIVDGGGRHGFASAARPLSIVGQGTDRLRAERCLTSAIYYEAASESEAGQRAVAQVVLNRLAHPAYPKTVCGVVYQGSERWTGCQFSFTCDGSLARRPQRLFWERAAMVAREALSGYVYSPVGLATHYHTLAVNPYWAPSLQQLGTIGAHRFYRFKGSAGAPGAFRFAYAGGEPLAAPHPRETTLADTRPDLAADPLAIQRAFNRPAHSDAGTAPTQTLTLATSPAYAPAIEGRGGDALYRSRSLPSGGEVLPAYRESGAWLADPSS